MPFENLFKIAFGEKKNSNQAEHKDYVGTDSHIEVAPYDTTKDATESEIEILEKRYGELKEGMIIWIELHFIFHQTKCDFFLIQHLVVFLKL